MWRRRYTVAACKLPDHAGLISSGQVSAVTERRRRRREGTWLRLTASTSAVFSGTGPVGVVHAACGGLQSPDAARLKTDDRRSRERLRAACEYSCQSAGRSVGQVLSRRGRLDDLKLPYVAKTLA